MDYMREEVGCRNEQQILALHLDANEDTCGVLGGSESAELDGAKRAGASLRTAGP
jgi:hypothetical protein